MDEAETVHKTLTEHLGINLTVVVAKERFLKNLQGVIDPEEKRKIIGRTFIEVFQERAREIEKEAANNSKVGSAIEWLLQGTSYPDVVSNLGVDIPLLGLKHEFQDMSWLSRHVARRDIMRSNRQY